MNTTEQNASIFSLLERMIPTDAVKLYKKDTDFTNLTNKVAAYCLVSSRFWFFITTTEGDKSVMVCRNISQFIPLVHTFFDGYSCPEGMDSASVEDIAKRMHQAHPPTMMIYSGGFRTKERRSLIDAIVESAPAFPEKQSETILDAMKACNDRAFTDNLAAIGLHPFDIYNRFTRQTERYWALNRSDAKRCLRKTPLKCNF